MAVLCNPASPIHCSSITRKETITMNPKKLDRQVRSTVPQLRVRTDVTAGASVENCYANVLHWRKLLEGKCAKKQALSSL